MVCREMLNLVQHDRVQNVIPNLIRDLFYFVDKTKQMLLHLFLTFFLLYKSRTWFGISLHEGSEMLNQVQHFRIGKVFFKKTGKVLEINVVLLYINGTCRDGGIGRHKGLKIPRQLNDVPVRLRFSAVGCSLWTAFFYAFVFYARMRGTNSREMLILKHSL